MVSRFQLSSNSLRRWSYWADECFPSCYYYYLTKWFSSWKYHIVVKYTALTIVILLTVASVYVLWFHFMPNTFKTCRQKFSLRQLKVGIGRRSLQPVCLSTAQIRWEIICCRNSFDIDCYRIATPSFFIILSSFCLTSLSTFLSLSISLSHSCLIVIICGFLFMWDLSSRCFSLHLQTPCT